MRAVKTKRAFTEKIPNAWAKGTGCSTIDPYSNDQEMPQDEYFYFGILRGSGDMLKRSIANDWDYYYCDHAYFLAGHQHPDPWYRITKNNLVSSNMRQKVSDDRYKKYFEQELLPWRKDSLFSKIIVCPPTGAIEWFYDTHNWLTTTVQALKQQTTREIVVRDKPMDPQVATKNGITQLIGFNKRNDAVSLEDDLQDAYCVVTFNSNVAIKAACMGIPVICGNECAAYPIANKLEDIENLEFKDREPWLNHLAYSQFRLSEIQSGYAYDIVSQT